MARLEGRHHRSGVHSSGGLRLALIFIHGAIIAYVALGWLIPSRPFLFVYLLVLPLIVLQWLVNGGASIVNNLENMMRAQRWHDPRNSLEGGLLRALLASLGWRAGPGLVNFAVCAAMLIFWVAALWRMVLIVPAPPG